MFISEKKIRQIIAGLFNEGLEDGKIVFDKDSDDNDILSQDIIKIYQDELEIHDLIQSMLAATSETSSETGFGNKFENILLNKLVRHMNFEDQNVSGLNVPGSKTTEFADVVVSPKGNIVDHNSTNNLFDGSKKCYYSVKSTIYDVVNPMVNKSETSKASLLGQRLYREFYDKNMYDPSVAGIPEKGPWHPQYIELRIGLIAAYLNMKISRLSGYKGIGITVDVAEPKVPNFAVRYDSTTYDDKGKAKHIFKNYLLRQWEPSEPVDDKSEATEASEKDNNAVEIRDVSIESEINSDSIIFMDPVQESVTAYSANSFIANFFDGGKIKHSYRRYHFILYSSSEEWIKSISDTSKNVADSALLAQQSTIATAPRVLKPNNINNYLVKLQEDLDNIINDSELEELNIEKKQSRSDILRAEYRDAVKAWKKCHDAYKADNNEKAMKLFNLCWLIMSNCLNNWSKTNWDPYIEQFKKLTDKSEEINMDDVPKPGEQVNNMDNLSNSDNNILELYQYDNTKSLYSDDNIEFKSDDEYKLKQFIAEINRFVDVMNSKLSSIENKIYESILRKLLYKSVK